LRKALPLLAKINKTDQFSCTCSSSAVPCAAIDHFCVLGFELELHALWLANEANDGSLSKCK